MKLYTKELMKWDIEGHLENQSRVSWKGNSTCITEGKDKIIRLSTMFVVNCLRSNHLHSFEEKCYGGKQSNEEKCDEDLNSRRWYLVITDLPKCAKFGNRSVQVTFYAADAANASVIDGSTFGEISVWEVSPAKPDEIALVIDFTKACSQDHQFGVHVLIWHNVKPVFAKHITKPIHGTTGKEIPMESNCK